MLSVGTIIKVSKLVQEPQVPNGPGIGLQIWCNLGSRKMHWKGGCENRRGWSGHTYWGIRVNLQFYLQNEAGHNEPRLRVQYSMKDLE